MARPFICPYCGLSDSVAKGFRKTKTMGKRRIRLCKSCGRKFTPKKQNRIEDNLEPTQSDEPDKTDDEDEHHPVGE